MPLPLGSIFPQASDYDFNHIVAAHQSCPVCGTHSACDTCPAGVVCSICGGPYTKHATFRDGMCQPIRIEPCGHITGLQCFRKWVHEHPDTCPCGKHALEPKVLRKFGPRRIGRWICSTKWFKFGESLVLARAFNDHTRHPTSVEYAEALSNLHDGKAMKVHAYQLLVLHVATAWDILCEYGLIYTKVIVAGSVFMWMLLSVAQSTLGYVINTVGWSVTWSCCAIYVLQVLAFLWILGVLYMVLFILTVSCVLYISTCMVGRKTIRWLL